MKKVISYTINISLAAVIFVGCGDVTRAGDAACDAAKVHFVNNIVQITNENIEEFCNACFTGEYPTGDITAERLRSIAGNRCLNRGETMADESTIAGV